VSAGVGVSALGGSECAGVGVNVWSLRRWRLSRKLLGSGESVCAMSASTRCDLADVLRGKRTASEATASRAHQRANAPPPPHLNAYSNKQLRMHTNEQQGATQQQLNAPTSKISLPPPRLKGNAARQPAIATHTHKPALTGNSYTHRQATSMILADTRNRGYPVGLLMRTTKF
jgi:hypothetical protein